MQALFILAKQVAIEALLTRFFITIFTLVLIGVGLAMFLGQIAIIEQQAAQSSLVGAFLRLSAVYMISLFVITNTIREFNESFIYVLFSLPVNRHTYLLGKLLGFCIVSTVTALLFGITLLYYAPALQVGLWTMSLICELFIIVTLSLLCALTFHQLLQAFSTVLGFYILTRSISAIQLMAQDNVSSANTWFEQLLNNSIYLLAMLLPDLGRFTQTEWLVYNTGEITHLIPIFFQTIIYVVLLISMNLFDLYRKNL